MAVFLVRSFDDPRGYVEYRPPGGLLPRTREESWVPWALTADKRVVYAKTGEHTGFRGGGGAHRLTPYGTHASQQRRAVCESELGSLALSKPHYTRQAVEKVSSGVRNYLLKRFWADQQGTVKCVFDGIGHYFFTNGGTGFGRISQANKSALGPKGVWDKILETLGEGRVDQVMAIHDAVGRKVLADLGGPPLQDYERIGGIVRQAWFDDSKRRGRAPSPAQVAKQVQPTTTAGIVGASAGANIAPVAQSRTRGVDMFARDHKRTSDPDADAYYDDVDVRNLLFGAGISGTTGSLLQAAVAFGGVSRGEPFKQYVMAIIGYLVGGGMHSYHETMAVAAKLGVDYDPGGFIRSLPDSFLHSADFRSWNERHYDIVTLGATHWRHNAGALPSHLNTSLTRA